MVLLNLIHMTIILTCSDVASLDHFQTMDSCSSSLAFFSTICYSLIGRLMNSLVISML